MGGGSERKQPLKNSGPSRGENRQRLEAGDWGERKNLGGKAQNVGQ